MNESDVWKYEDEAYKEGYSPVCGCDEAGAGPLAGPVFAAAVILPRGLIIPGLTDSKKMTSKKRDELFEVIRNEAVSFAVAQVDEKTIDNINILNARLLAMDKAIRALRITPALALIDGNRSNGISIPNRCIVGGDALSASISAASVLAKVSRDRYMVKMGEIYPQYGFEQHKGYGTKLHYERLKQFGPCPIHRMTFLRNLH